MIFLSFKNNGTPEMLQRININQLDCEKMHDIPTVRSSFLLFLK